MEDKKSELTSEDEEVINSLKKDCNNFKCLVFAGSFAILFGGIIGGGSLFLSMDKSYVLAGIFFITIGIFTIRDSIRNKRIYQLLRKLL